MRSTTSHLLTFIAFLFGCSGSGGGTENADAALEAAVMDMGSIPSADAARPDGATRDADAIDASDAELANAAIDATTPDATLADADLLDADTRDADWPDAELADAAPDAPPGPTTYTCAAAADQAARVPFACPGVPTCDTACDAVVPESCTQTCTPWGSCKYECPPPSCTCTGGTTHEDVACNVNYAMECDPVCEPPRCHTECAEDSCAADNCPSCEGVCGEASCTWRCREGQIDSCAPVFGCELTPPIRCTTSCRPPACAWYLLEESYPITPSCLDTPSSSLRVIDGGTGLDCSDMPMSEAPWGIICERPECEIRCPGESELFATCGQSAACDVDCEHPTCTVQCDTPSCTASEDGGYDCTPPANCVTTCECAIGNCSRTE